MTSGGHIIHASHTETIIRVIITRTSLISPILKNPLDSLSLLLLSGFSALVCSKTWRISCAYFCFSSPIFPQTYSIHSFLTQRHWACWPRWGRCSDPTIQCSFHQTHSQHLLSSLGFWDLAFSRASFCLAGHPFSLCPWAPGAARLLVFFLSLSTFLFFFDDCTESQGFKYH